MARSFFAKHRDDLLAAVRFGAPLKRLALAYGRSLGWLKESFAGDSEWEEALEGRYVWRTGDAARRALGEGSEGERIRAALGLTMEQVVFGRSFLGMNRLISRERVQRLVKLVSPVDGPTVGEAAREVGLTLPAALGELLRLKEKVVGTVALDSPRVFGRRGRPPEDLVEDEEFQQILARIRARLRARMRAREVGEEDPVDPDLVVRALLEDHQRWKQRLGVQ